MASQLASLLEDQKSYHEQLDIVLTQLKDDPGNDELLSLQAELNDMISLLNESIAELKPTQALKPAAREPSPSPKEKLVRESHPAFSKAAPTTDDKEDATATYQVNDTILAKWVSGDKAFYPARITSITGSSSAPIYIVKFKNYDTTETLRAKDIRPVSNKRKADGTPASTGSSYVPSHASSAIASAPGSGVVASAAASMYPEQQARKEAEKKAADGTVKPPKAKKIKANKELEAGKSKWQDFNNKSKVGKVYKKDSMFRTPEGIRGRVGFTGSGQAMRKDPTRSRHVYQTNDELD